VRALWYRNEDGRLYNVVSDMQLSSYGDYHKCPTHDGVVLSAAHGETCPECGWPEE